LFEIKINSNGHFLVIFKILVIPASKVIKVSADRIEEIIKPEEIITVAGDNTEFKVGAIIGVRVNDLNNFLRVAVIILKDFISGGAEFKISKEGERFTQVEEARFKHSIKLSETESIGVVKAELESGFYGITEVIIKVIKEEQSRKEPRFVSKEDAVIKSKGLDISAGFRLNKSKSVKRVRDILGIPVLRIGRSDKNKKEGNGKKSP